MPNRWILVIDSYTDQNKKAINMLCGTFSGYLDSGIALNDTGGAQVRFFVGLHHTFITCHS